MASKKTTKKISVKSYLRHRKGKVKRVRVKRYFRRRAKLSVAVYVKKYEKVFRKKKGILRRKYTKELVGVLRKKGYSEEEIERIKKYSLVGIQKKIAKEKLIITKFSKDGERAYIREKGWVSVSSLNRSLKMLEYWGRVKAYKDLMGISVKEARKLLIKMEKEPELGVALKKIVYPTMKKALAVVVVR